MHNNYELNKPTQLIDYPQTRYFSNESLPTIPEGPWDASNNTLPCTEQVRHFTDLGLKIDSLGRPLHPNLAEKLKHGVLANKGFFWEWGPNYTVDPVVLAENKTKILLVLRSDNHKWAFPGGFMNPNETVAVAAAREAKEETTISLDIDEAKIIFKGILGDHRSTAHSWTETTAVRWLLGTSVFVEGKDDALAAAWFNVKQLPKNMFEPHLPIIDVAVSAE